MFRNLPFFALVCALGAHAVPVPQVAGEFPPGIQPPPVQGPPAPDLSRHGTCTEDRKGFWNGDKIQVVPDGTQCEDGYLVYYDW